ncbi:hypothetical protein [Lewinella sp. JB7]|uniref:hypothetical protein n=1 Tax=Lewinella sp. JB7 TaxID=2962887 RepID=UPI0020C98021|nr:hypothetical protein [Lewinella sp. JB7]MCP9237158.1 hypothetical protein [Lewinella sp. JB7]
MANKAKPNTLQIAGQDWPVRWDFTAIKRTLPLAGLSRMSEADRIGDELPFEAVPTFIRNLIRSGLSRAKDDREAPTVEQIEEALNDDLTLTGRAFQAVAGDSSGSQPADTGGKKKPRTPKP